MNNDLKTDVGSIIKFVTNVYSPDDIRVTPVTPEHYNIVFYFNEIDDKYITNPQHRDTEELKINMFNREIRTYIENYLGIKTTGLQPPDFFPPMVNHPISIYVRYAH